MTPILTSHHLDIIADGDEELTICRDTVHKDRVVVFKTLKTNVYQEVHFDRVTGNLIDRAARRQTLPKFEYPFERNNLSVIIEHKFLDELAFKGYQPEGVDIETITVTIMQDNKEVSSRWYMGPTNKSAQDYAEEAKRCVDSYLEERKSKAAHQRFLEDTYAKLNITEKVNYHHGVILFADRMQGGYPSGYKNPAATYLSKWFMDTFSPYNEDPFTTLKLVAEDFKIDTKYLSEMIKYDIESNEWKEYARKLDLLDN